MDGQHITLRLPPDREGLVTEYIQEALDRCRESGGTVTLEEGLWRIGSLRLWSNTTLKLSAGTVLQASGNIEDYTDFHVPTTLGYVREPFVKEAWNLPDHYIMAPIVAFGEENVAVIGEGGSLIDGADCYDPEGEERFRGPMGMVMSDCRNVTLRGYTYRNAANWAHQLDSCQNVRIEQVTVLGGHDGVNIHHCEDVTIENCDFRTGDDCVAGYDAERVTIRNCSFNTACSAFRFGGRDLLVENCRFWGPGEYPHRVSGRHNTLTAFLYYSMKYDHIRQDSGNWRIRNCTVENVDMLIDYHYGKDFCQEGHPLTDITMENVKVTGLLKPSALAPMPGAPLRAVFRDVTMAKREGAPEGGLFVTTEDVELLLENTKTDA